MKPRWMRRNFSCPNCGHVYESEGDLANHTIRGERKAFGTYSLKVELPVAVKCPRCGDYRDMEDFDREQ